MIVETCFYCNAPFTKKGEHRATWDHKIPKSRGGNNGIQNLVKACFKCNQEKGMLTAEEFFVVLRHRAETNPRIGQLTPRAVFNSLFKTEGYTMEDHAFLYAVGVSCE